MAGSWPQHVKFTLRGHPFTHFGVVLSVTFIPALSFVCTIDVLLTDDARLFPSLYFNSANQKYAINNVSFTSDDYGNIFDYMDIWQKFIEEHPQYPIHVVYYEDLITVFISLMKHPFLLKNNFKSGNTFF